MAVNAANVQVGFPDQDVTGAISSAPLGSDLPDSASWTPTAEYASTGFVSEEGVTLALDTSTTDIPDWSGSVVRKIMDSFDGTFAWEHLEVNEESLKVYFGDDNVEVTPATAESGKQIKVSIGAHELPRKSWAFRMKDGPNKKAVLVVPDGQVTERGDIVFVSNAAITLPVTMTAYPDAQGNSIYWYTDDGVFAA